jgi:dephospho-CoA kinase
VVKYFGTQVCQEDGTLDRKKISDIVFKDMEKRKKLEEFTHPRIYEEFFRQLAEFGKEDPGRRCDCGHPPPGGTESHVPL